MDELALFAGAGLGLLGTHHLLGWRCVGYVEMAEYPCKVLEARIKDGLLSKAPIFQMHTRDFIRLGLAEKYRGVARVITAGFPCQPFSYSGEMAAGNDERNGWPDTLCIIRIVRPEWVFLENVTGLLAGSHGYFGTILKDLAQSGYDVCWRVLSAAEVGAPHKRDRVWIIAHTNSYGRYRQETRDASPDKEWHNQARQQGRPAELYETVTSSEIMADASIKRTSAEQQSGQWSSIIEGCATLADSHCQRQQQPQGAISQERGWTGYGGTSLAFGEGQRQQAIRAIREQGSPPRLQERELKGGSDRTGEWWAVEPELGRVANGVSNRVDRLRAIGNGQVPAVVREVWKILTVRAA